MQGRIHAVVEHARDEQFAFVLAKVDEMSLASRFAESRLDEVRGAAQPAAVGQLMERLRQLSGITIRLLLAPSIRAEQPNFVEIGFGECG